MKTHPMLGPVRYWSNIHTLPIARLATDICKAMAAGYGGIHVDGRARTGKTEAIKELHKDQSWVTNAHPMVLLTIPRRSNYSDSIFYKIVQNKLSMPQSSSWSGVDRLEQIYAWCAEECARTGINRVTFLINEAGFLTLDDYDYLANIDDCLSLGDIKLFCVFAHQKDYRRRRAITEEDLDPSIAGRFFLARHTFTGLNGLKDIADALHQYDSLMEFEGVKFTAHFAPAAYARGWRLSSHAADFVSAISMLREGKRYLGGDDLAMVIFEPTIHKLLTQVISECPDFQGFELKHILWALEESGYHDLERARDGLPIARSAK